MTSKLGKVLGLLLLVSMVLAACTPAATQAPVPTEPPAPVVVPATEVPPTEVPATAAPVAPAFCMDAKSGDQVSVMYQWSGAEEEKFNTIIKPFVDGCGVKVVANPPVMLQSWTHVSKAPRRMSYSGPPPHL